jgi:hypothetical protein
LKKIIKVVAAYLAVSLALVLLALTVADWGGRTPIYYDQRDPGFFGRMNEAVKDYIGELNLKQFFTTDLGHLVKKTKYKGKTAEMKRRDISQAATATDSTMLLNGFSLVYRDNAHRVNKLEASVDGVGPTSGGGVAAVGSVAFEGGDWSRIDGIQYSLTALPVKASEARFAHGSFDLDIVGGRAKSFERIDLAAIGMAGFEKVAVILRGFQFEAGEEYPDGYNTKGVSVRLIPSGREGDKLDVDVVAELKAGEVAFRPDPGYFYTARAKVMYTVVGGDAGAFRRAEKSYTLLNRERAPMEIQRVATAFDPGDGVVVAAFEGFEFDVHTTKARFLRGLELSIDAVEYDPKTGRVEALCDGYLSNAGTWAGALDVRFAADILFIKLPSAAVAAPVVLKGEMSEVTETGSFDIKADFR